MIKWKKLFEKKTIDHEQVIKEVKNTREETNKKIDNMVAQLNGCGDRWFLKPYRTIDECDKPEYFNGEV